jgi:hypothetical protein
VCVEKAIKRYEQKRNAFIQNEITVKEWTDYCTEALGELITLNIEILERLKGC